MQNSALEKAAVKKVKHEVDGIISSARNQLQLYVQDEEDDSSLQEVTSYLTTIERTLQLIQVNGASILAREMGDVVDGLMDGSITRKEEAQESLSHGILKMSDYLEYVQAGNKDVPIVLLPLLNDLRAVREAPLLSEHFLFFPNFDDIEVPNVSASFGMSAQEFAKKVRYGFQVGLVGLIQNDQIDVSATKICKVAIRLHQCSKELASRRLWWVCSAVAQAVAINVLPTSSGLASLLGQVDRQIKSFAELDEEEFAKNIPAGLVKNLLYYVGIAENRGRIVNKVKTAYGLDDLIPNELDMDQIRENIAGPSIDVLNAVSKALFEDIATIKDIIELYVHSENRSPESVSEVGEKLQKIADTLSMLGLEEPREEVMREVALLGGLSENELEHADSSFVNVAETLIKAESIVENFVNYRANYKSEVVNTDIDAVENEFNIEKNTFKKVQIQTITEALKEIEEIKNSISELLQAPEDQEKLSEVQNRISTVIGALSILKFDDVASILESIQSYLVENSAAEQLSSMPEKLDAFADSVTSVECYLEALVSLEDNAEDILDYGMESVSRLTGNAIKKSLKPSPVKTIEISEIVDEEQENENDLELEDVSATTIGLSLDEDIGFDDDLSIEPATDQDSEKKNTGKTVNDEIQDLSATSIGIVLDESLFDDEIIQQNDLDSVYVNPKDIENNLPKDDDVEYKPLDQTIIEVRDEEESESIELTSDSLPVILEEDILTKTDESDGVEIEINDDFDNNISEHNDLNVVTNIVDGEEKQLIVIAEDADAEILEIFIEEAEEEIEKITQNLPIWCEDATNEEVLATVRRSYHTLKGSGRLIGAEIIAEFAWQYENILNKVIENIFDVTPDLHKILTQSIDILPQLLMQLKRDEAPSVDLQVMFDSVVAFGLQGNSNLSSNEVINNVAEDSNYDSKDHIENTEIEVFESVDEELSKESEENYESENLDEELSKESEENFEPENLIDASTDEVIEQDYDLEFDAELNEIFVTEAIQHIEKLDEIFNASDSKKILEVDDALIQAVHTLHGSSRTAEANAIAEICNELERYFLQCQAKNFTVQQDAYSLVSAGLESIKHVITEHYENPKVATTDQILLKQLCDLQVVDMPAQDTAASKADQQDEVNDEVNSSSLEHDGIDVEPENVDRYEDKDPDLVEIFLEEAGDILAASNECLENWRKDQGDQATLSELKRQLHTLKGSARMAAYSNIGDFSHSVESLVIPVAEGNIKANEEVFSLLQRCFDSLYSMIDAALLKQPVYPEKVLISEINKARGVEVKIDQQEAISDQAFAEPAKQRNSEDKVEEKLDHKLKVKAKAVVRKIPVLRSVVEQEEPVIAQNALTQQQAIRLEADLLDNLVNNAGEVNILHSRIEQVTNKYTGDIKELEQVVNRLREQLRRLELETEAQILSTHAHEANSKEDFDPLELDRYSNIQQLSRSLAESVNDLLSIKDIMHEQVRESEILLMQQHRVSADLQEGLMRTRMVQFNQIMPRMQRIVRQTAHELNKQADIIVVGGDTEIDRSILNRIVAPLEHVLRNSLAHGIESPDERKSLNKDAMGEIAISVNREGSEIVIRVSDDGAGINIEKVKQIALDKGLIESLDIAEHDALNLILMPGFTTAGAVTQVAGRGVGMDVVASELNQLGGFLQIDSVQGQGASFTIHIPYTLAIAQALLVKCGDEIYAAPLASVEGIVRLSVYELKQKFEEPNPSYHYADQDYNLCHLGSMLHINNPQTDGADSMLPVLLVRAGKARLAIQVEATLGNREIVVKPLASQLSRLPAVSGATILGDGSVVLILDMQGLIRMHSSEQDINNAAINESSVSNKLPTIMVVDDSITIRKVTTRFLERNHYNVVTAKDGVDAVQKLQDFTPDMMLLDIEMPRMDGYELATHIRNNDRLKDTPIIMITSRTGDKHRQRAMDIGVQEYLGKPYNESELLTHIKTVLE